MERSGPGAPAVHHYDDLARLLGRESGFYVTVWASRPGLTPKAITSRVQAVHDRAKKLLPVAVIEELVHTVESAFPQSAGVVVVADAAGVVFREHLPEAPSAELLRVGSLPSLSPVIEHRQTAIPFVVVVADRRGGDLYWSTAEAAGSTSVDGDDTFIRKVQAGGWSHKKFQQRAENTWEHTADQIATDIVGRVASVAPRVITMAGDVRVTEMLRKRMPEAIAALVRVVPGGRSADGSEAARDAEIRRWIRTAIAEDTVAVLRLFDQQRGQRDRAAVGADATLAAMREARVDILLVHDDPDDDRLGYFVPGEPALVATHTGVLRDLGRDDAHEGRMIDIAIRTAILTGAGIRVVPHTTRLTEGMGAILRW